MSLKSVVIISDTGRSRDITTMVQAFAFYESLFANSMTGNIVLLDSVNVQELLPIVGNEVLYASYNTSEGVFDLVFDVISIKDIKSKNQETKNYHLELASRSALLNANTKLKRRFTGSSSSIVEDILENEVGIDPSFFDIEETIDKVSLLPPSSTPFAFINYLARNIGENVRSAFYLFETSKNHYFASLEKMQNLPSVATFNYLDVVDNKSPVNRRILNYTLNSRFDLLENVTNGVYASTVYTHDIINKTLSKTVRWNPNWSLLTYRFDYTPDNKISLHGDIDATSEINRDFINGDFNHNSLLVEIEGNGLLECSDKITINIPSTKSGDNKGNDVVLSGDYVVIKIKHFLANDNYKMVLELNKYDQ